MPIPHIDRAAYGIDPEQTKACDECLLEKKLTSFYLNLKSPDKLGRTCCKCLYSERRKTLMFRAHQASETLPIRKDKGSPIKDLTEQRFKTICGHLGYVSKTPFIFSTEGCVRILPFLIGYGITVEQLIGHGIYEAEQIEKASYKISTMTQKLDFEGWCLDFSWNLDEVMSGIRQRHPAFIAHRQAAIQYCIFKKIPKWSYLIEESDWILSVKRRSRKIIEACAVACGVVESELGGRGRNPQVVLCRALCVTAMRTFTPLSYPQIAKEIGRPNHSTTITAYTWFCDIFQAVPHRERSRSTSSMKDCVSAWVRMLELLGLPLATPPKYREPTPKAKAKKLAGAA